MRVAARPANADYPLGHGRAIYFWSFIVALMLFSMGGVFSIYEGLHKIGTGEPLESPWDSGGRAGVQPGGRVGVVVEGHGPGQQRAR